MAQGEPAKTRVHVGTPVNLPGLALLNGPVAPVTWTVASGTLPDGLSLDGPTGTVSGTPTGFNDGDKTSVLTLLATDAQGATFATDPFSLEVYGPLTLAAYADVETSVGHSEAQAPALTHAAPTASFAATGLPKGLSVDAGTGALSGAATELGTFQAVVTAIDGVGATATRSFAVTVRDTLGVASTTDQTARVGLSRVVAQAAAQNAVGTVTWSPAPGYAAPLGLSLDTTTGRLSGSPTTVGTTRYAFRAVDADGRVGLGAPFSVTVYSPLTIGAAGTFALRQDVPASVPAPSVGNTPAQPVAWTVAQGSAVPGNFTLDPVTGTVTGTPTAAQSNTVANMALTVTDAQGATISDNAAGQPAVLNFYPPLTVVTPGAQYGHVGQALSMAAPSVGSNPVAPTAWTAAVTLPDGTTSTSMPAGLALNAGTGAVTGTPTDAAVGVSTFRLTVRDATGGSVTTGPVSLTVRPAMTMAALSDYKVHDDVQHAFDVPAMTNASGTPSFVVASSPSGITPFVIATGQAGQRAGLAAATYAVTVTATDLSGATASRTFNALVAPPLALAAPASNAATYDVVSALPAPVASNVIGTATYGLASGTLPAGMTLATDTGVVSGTPTQVGTFPISLSVRDDTGTTAVSPSLNLIVSYVSASKTYPTTVTYNGTDAFGALWDASATSKVTTTSGGTLVATYADPVQFDGSVDTDLSTGAATLTYNSGTVASPVWKPVVAGTTYGAIQIREVTSAGYAPSRLRFGQAGAYPPSIQSISAATMTPFVGVAIAQDLDALMATANATGAKTWALASGSLPAGVTISGSQLVGTPTTPGLATFSLSVTDARGVASAPAVVTFNALSATLASNTYPSSVVDTGQAGDVTAAAYDNATATQLPSSLSISFPSVNGPSPTITYYTETFSFPASTTVSTIDVSSTELGTSPTVSYCSSDCGTASPTMTTIATTSSSGTVTLAYPISSNVFKVTGSAYLSPAGTTRYLTRERLGYAGAYPAALPSLTTTAALQRPVVGTAYSVALDALMATADTSGAETWRVVTGTLPPGLSLDPAGTVAGTPTTTGDYPVTLAVTDARGIASVAQPVTLSVQSNVQASTTYPASATSVGTGALATPVGTSNVASGVAAGYDGSAATAYPTVRANDGGDYAGVRYTFAQPVAWDGSVSSAPSAKALFYNVGTTASPTWKAWTSTVGVVTSTDFQVVTAGALTAARLGYGGSFPTYLPSVTGTKVRPVVGTPYSASLDSVLATQNGSGAETWAMTGGLPAGLTLDPVGGTISGTPTAIGDVSVTLAVTDARGIASTPATLILSVQSNVQASTVYPTGVVDVGAGSSNMAIPVATLYDASAATTLTNGSASSNGAVVTFAQPVSFDGSVDASPAATVAYNTGTAASPTWATWSAASGVVTSSQFKVTATSGFLARARIGYGGAYPASLPSLTATKDRPVVGTAYSASLDALMATANASGTEAWAMTGTLPAGLSFDPNAGTISGTPTATGDATVSLSVTDARGIASAPIALTLSVQSNVLASTAYPTTAGYMGDFAASPGNAISTTPVAATYDASSTTAAGGWNGYVNSAYSYGSNVTYTFAQPVSWDGSVSLQNASGYVTLWYLGPAGWTQWTSAAGAVTATRFAVVNNAPFSIAYLTGARLGYGGAYPAYLPSTTAASTQRPVVGAPYSVALDAVMGTTNASGPETWAVTAGTLPAGLSLDPVAGTISGTPTAVGDSTLTVTVTDSRGLPSVGATVTLSVQSNVLASTAYPSSFSSVGSTLLDAAYDNSAITTFSLGVNRGTPITFSYAQPVSFDGSVDTDLTSYQIYYVTPGGQSALWTATSGAVSTASISLLSTLPYYAVSPTVTRARLGYGGAYPAFLPSLTAGRDKPVVGTAYAGNLDAILAVANSSGGETWTLSSGTMPAGLTLDANGTVTGTPASSGDKTVTVSMTDVRGFATPPIALTLSVQSSVQASTVYPSSATSVACGAYNANCSTSTPVPVATTYDASLASAVGTTSGYSASGVRLTFAQPVAWDGSVAMTAGNGGTASPIGLYYNTGTTAAPTWATWTASSGVVTSTDFEVIYNGGVAGTLATAKVGYGNQFPAPLPSLVATKDRPVVGTPYSVSLDALMATASASGPETWALTSGTLPAGLSFDGSAGTISGTPTTPGDTVVTVTVTDARGIASAPVALTLSVQSSVLASTVYPSSATSVACGAYNANCSTSTPVPVATTYDASLASAVGTTSGNSLSGVRLTFAQPVTWDGSVAMTAGNGGTASPIGLYYNTGTTASPTWATWTAPNGVVTSTDFEVVFNGGVAGTLATAKVGYGNQFPTPLPSLTAGPRQLPLVGAAYSVGLDALLATTNASGPEAWSYTGTLPAGLSLDPVAGTISGTPTAAGDATVQVSVTDARGIASVPVPVLLSVQASVRASTAYPSSATSVGCGAVSPTGLCNAVVALPVATTYDASTVTAAPIVNSNYSGVRLTYAQPVAWDGSVTAATSVGAITPTNLFYNTGTTASPVWAPWTASVGLVSSTDFEVVYLSSQNALATARLGYGGQYPSALPSLTTPATVGTVVGIPYSASLSALAPATNLADAGAWSIASGSLPAGLTLGSDGTLSGTPTVGGSSTTATVTVADARGLPAVPVTLTATVAPTAAAVYALSATNSTTGNAVSVGGLYDASATTGTSLVAGGTLTLAFSGTIAWDGSLDAAFTGAAGAPQYNAGTTASPTWTNYASGVVTTTGIRFVASTAGTLSTLRAGFGGAFPGYLPSGTAATLSVRPNVATSVSLDATLATTNVVGGEFWARYSGAAADRPRPRRELGRHAVRNPGDGGNLRRLLDREGLARRLLGPDRPHDRGAGATGAERRQRRRLDLPGLQGHARGPDRGLGAVDPDVGGDRTAAGRDAGDVDRRAVGHADDGRHLPRGGDGQERLGPFGERDRHHHGRVGDLDPDERAGRLLPVLRGGGVDDDRRGRGLRDHRGRDDLEPLRDGQARHGGDGAVDGDGARHLGEAHGGRGPLDLGLGQGDVGRDGGQLGHLLERERLVPRRDGDDAPIRRLRRELRRDGQRQRHGRRLAPPDGDL